MNRATCGPNTIVQDQTRFPYNDRYLRALGRCHTTEAEATIVKSSSLDVKLDLEVMGPVQLF